MLSPSRQPSLFGGRDFLLERGERIAAARPFLPADLGDERIEHQRSIADHGMVDAVLLVDVGGVVGGMDDGLAGGKARSGRGGGEARAARPDAVGFSHKTRGRAY